MPAKSIFLSKIFWVNVLGLVVSVSQILPPKVSLPVLAVANIGLRLVTDQPIKILR